MFARKAMIALGLSLAAFGATPQANASTAQSCAIGTPDATDRVSGTTDCEFIADMGANSDYSDAFFGGGFVEIERFEFTLLDLDHLTISGGATQGTYAISSDLQSIYETLVLVFKTGSGDNTTPGEAVAYIVGGALAGDWLSPFTRTTGQCDGTTYDGGSIDEASGCTREVSHIALLGRLGEDVPGVPLPGALPLLLTAGAAAFALRRRKA